MACFFDLLATGHHRSPYKADARAPLVQTDQLLLLVYMLRIGHVSQGVHSLFGKARKLHWPLTCRGPPDL